MKSVYVVQVSVGEPGDLAWSEHHLVTSAEQVRAAIDELCRSPARRRENCFWFDTAIGVWVIQPGAVHAFVDLRHLISASSTGRTLSELIAESFDAEAAARAGALPSLKFDWRRASTLLPSLQAPLMEPGDELAFTHALDDRWLAHIAGATLGSHFMS